MITFSPTATRTRSPSPAHGLATPHQRVVKHERMRKRPITQMNAAFKRIKPAALSRQLLALAGKLETLALAQKPGTVKPVNRAWNN